MVPLLLLLSTHVFHTLISWYLDQRDAVQHIPRVVQFIAFK